MTAGGFRPGTANPVTARCRPGCVRLGSGASGHALSHREIAARSRDEIFNAMCQR